MDTATMEVDDLLSPLAGRGLEEHLSQTAGIGHADVNDASGGVSVTYGPAILNLAAIRALVKRVRLSLQRRDRSEARLLTELRARRACLHASQAAFCDQTGGEAERPGALGKARPNG